MNQNDYPVVLTAKEVAEILNVGKVRAYEIMETEDFPLVRIGKRKRVLRDKFFNWLENHAS